MAKYNLLEDDDIFDEEDDFSEKEEAEKPKPEQEPETDKTDNLDIDIDDDLFTTADQDEEISLDEEPTAGKSMKKTILDEEQTEPEISIPDSEPEPEQEFQEFEPVAKESSTPPEQATEKPYLTDDYEDEKQSGINYKPILMVVAAITAVVLIYFLVDMYILSDTSESDVAEQKTEQPAKTPEQIRQEQEAARKKEFLGTLDSETKANVSNINTILDNVQNTARLSSILLYDESLLLEVFGSDRSELARVNINLKDKMSGKTFNIVSSQSRPGPNGGVFGLFKAEVNGGASGGSQNVNINFNTVADAQNWLKQQSNAQGLRVKDINNHFIADENNFKKFNVEATINGSLTSCRNLLNKLSSDGSQLKINKLSLTAGDQKNFQSKNYQLKLVLEVFV